MNFAFCWGGFLKQDKLFFEPYKTQEILTIKADLTAVSYALFNIESENWEEEATFALMS